MSNDQDRDVRVSDDLASTFQTLLDLSESHAARDDTDHEALDRIALSVREYLEALSVIPTPGIVMGVTLGIQLGLVLQHGTDRPSEAWLVQFMRGAFHLYAQLRRESN